VVSVHILCAPVSLATRRIHKLLKSLNSFWVELLQAELEPASQDLLAWPQTLPGGGECIERPELVQLLSLLRERASSTTAVVGPPGAVKSALMAALGHALSKCGWPVLAIKADLLDTRVTTEADLQARLGLSEKPSTILERLAKLRPVVLLVDELDALAGYLDISTGRLSVLLNLVRRLGRTDNVHIVLSARTLEYEHDVRLRAISAESLSLQLPAWSQVLAVLEAKGIQAAGWPADAQEVMRSPQARATYVQLEGHAKSEPFITYQAMQERLWSERVLAGEQGPRRAQLAYDIADRMAEEESLWLASARFDSQRNDIQALIALGVLTTYGSDGSIGFIHQTLFDYALARGFAQSRGRLSRYVLERQTSLFLRPKLWAALSYLRAVERPTYEVELETIWLSPGLRRHLWLLLLDFIGQQSAPTDREALLMEKALQQAGDRALGFRALAGSPGCFKRFANSFIASAMSETGGAADLTVGC
jgi:SpoVK/Ycf46/Vps4 family AAA+-type ATPase